jgi:pimeloyl-ACP methyl ester carboxylesterase
VAWAPCPENPALQCGVLELPVDYRHPQGPHFGMAVIKAPATGPGERMGVVIVGPGGPGGSGVNTVLGAVAAPVVARVRQRFDVVSFDPRGAARSRPVKCKVEFGPPPAANDDAAQAAYFDEVGRRYLQACEQQNGPFIFEMSTNNIARDVEMLRRSLGVETFSFIGSSGGTQIGAVYASMFPKRLRATLLDGSFGAQTGGNALLDLYSEQNAGYEAALTRLDLLCGKDKSCALKSVGVRQAFDAVAARLRKQPALIDGVMLSDDELDATASAALDTERLMPVFINVLHAAYGGDDAPLAQLFKSLARGVGSFDALLPIVCNTFTGRLSAERYLPIDAVAREMHPRIVGKVQQQQPSRPYFAPRFILAACSAWPQGEETVLRNVAQELSTPVLLIANDFDGATPPAWSRRMASLLGFERSVFYYRGGGHTVTGSGNPCTDDVIVKYLVDLQLPVEGATCPALPLRFSLPGATQPTAARGGATS